VHAPGVGLRDQLTRDLLIGAALATAGKKGKALDDALRDLSPMVAGLLNAAADGRARTRKEVLLKGTELLNAGRQGGQPPRTPFHWALEFPIWSAFSSNLPLAVGP
jgi:hypothetical protein